MTEVKRCRCKLCRGPLGSKIELDLSPEKIELYRLAAAARGLTLPAFVRHAISEQLDDMEKDGRS